MEKFPEESIKTLAEISRYDVASAGGKGASLGEMLRAGLPIPAGFVILSRAFDSFLEETAMNVEIDAALAKVEYQEMHSVERAAEDIQALILAAKMPKGFKKVLLEAFDLLGAEYVAVRSSATAEDGASAAWAGQLDTFLNSSRKTLVRHVQKCWASLFTARAIFYRFENGLQQESISVAVVIQKMVDANKSGIAFSVHPVTEDKNQLIIEAGPGLGEAIVSGQITPDSYVVTKSPRKILDKKLTAHERGLFRKKGGGNEWRKTENNSEQLLEDDEILQLADLVIKIEKHFGFPCDIEWAKEGKSLFFTQSRPITTLM